MDILFQIPFLVGFIILLTLLTLAIIIRMKIQIIQNFLQLPQGRKTKGIALINIIGSIPVIFAMLIILGPFIGDIAMTFWYSSGYGSSDYSTQKFASIVLRYWGIIGLIFLFVEGTYLASEAKDSDKRSIWKATIVGNLLSYLIVSIVSILMYHFLQGLSGFP